MYKKRSHPEELLSNISVLVGSSTAATVLHPTKNRYGECVSSVICDRLLSGNFRGNPSMVAPTLVILSIYASSRSRRRIVKEIERVDLETASVEDGLSAAQLGAFVSSAG